MLLFLLNSTIYLKPTEPFESVVSQPRLLPRGNWKWIPARAYHGDQEQQRVLRHGAVGLLCLVGSGDRHKSFLEKPGSPDSLSHM